MKSSEMSIGELATRFGLAPHVLRHWESMGLLTPNRETGGQRRYDDADLARVAMILMGKEAGFGLGSCGTCCPRQTRWTMWTCSATTSPYSTAA
jgi:DNA-binding transcriptional MerR regulator